jgi:hypothetical protein
MNTSKRFSVVFIFLSLGTATVHAQLLLDRFVTENPRGAIQWTRAGVREDLSNAVIGAIGNAANEPVIYNVTRLTATEQGAIDLARPDNPALGGIRFPGNPLLNSYVWFRENGYTLSISGFTDAQGRPVPITQTPQAPYENVTGNTFTLQPSRTYRLYLFGVGYRDGEHTAFTFNGETKTANPSGRIIGSEENRHMAVFEFTTPMDLFGWTLTFSAEAVGTIGAFNGLALVPVQ